MSHQSGWPLSNRQGVTGAGEDVETRGPHVLSGNVNWFSHRANSMHVPHKVKNRTTM